MTHGADPAHAADTAPRANAALARECEACRGWGTIVTEAGEHELCPACQSCGSASVPAPPGSAHRRPPFRPLPEY